ncbi:MAG: hypothetical protein QOI59_6804 [Gammaproteobacteria bacterium]|jgi:hypothetical protein|nr:hypothetical protein [Gammaproteobacteria bacterium]
MPTDIVKFERRGPRRAMELLLLNRTLTAAVGREGIAAYLGKRPTGT